MTDFYGIMNYKLNELKSRRPDDLALIEAVQTEINKKIPIISPETRKSLLQFPIQFTQKIRTSARDWTTQLHKWADYQLHDLLMIDPIYLTTTDSDDECVLKHLVKAALGVTMTNVVNYELIEELFQKDMSYAAMAVAGDPESVEAGNAWYEPDLNKQSVIEYLYDFASGEGEFDGKEKDNRILAMFDKYAERALALPDEEELSADHDDSVDQEAEQEAVLQAEAERENSMATNPNEVPVASGSNDGEQTEKMDAVNGEATVDENGQIAPPQNDDAKGQDKLSTLFNVLLKLGNSLGDGVN